MADPADYRRVRDDDPERCLSDTAFGQCSFQRIEGGNHCRIHAGSGTLKKIDQAQARSYQLTRWKGRVDDFASSPNVKTLREELGIARMTLEQILEGCKDAIDIQINSNKIGQMLERIEKLVIACDKIETKMAYNLDKSDAILLAQSIINIIHDEVEDLDIIERIADKIGAVILTAGVKKAVLEGSI